MNHKARTILLATTAIVTAFTLGKSVVDPQTVSTDNNYTFPESVELPQWQLSVTKPVDADLVKPPAYISGDFVAGKHYQYLQSGKYLDIEMRYLANTDGDLKSFITTQTGELSSVLKQDKDIGLYSLYTQEDKAYLSACINPRGNTTVTSDGFNRNLMTHDTRLWRIFPWLLGQADFRDKRCLWAHLSTSLNNDVGVDETYKTLEIAWRDWYQYWRSHYPDSKEI